MGLPPETLLEVFHELARSLRDAAKGGDLARVNEILDERHHLIEKLEARAIDDPRERESRRALQQSILELDREAEALLKQRLGELGAEIASLDSGRRALGGYAAKARRAPKCIDERG
jgi:hypothetical protein